MFGAKDRPLPEVTSVIAELDIYRFRDVSNCYGSLVFWFIFVLDFLATNTMEVATY